MNWITHKIIVLSINLKPFSIHISVAFISGLMVIFGNQLNSFCSYLIQTKNYLVRVFMMSALYTFGYGFFAVWIASQVQQLILQIPNVFFAPAVMLSFLILGFLADRQTR